MLVEDGRRHPDRRHVYVAVARQLNAVLLRQGGQRAAAVVQCQHHPVTADGPHLDQPVGRHRRQRRGTRLGQQAQRYQAMFPGQSFSAPFFIQYGPGNTQTADGGDKYLYSVSNDGYAYNGNYLHLARVPLNKIQTASAWQYYHVASAGPGNSGRAPTQGHPDPAVEERPEPAGDPVRAEPEPVPVDHVLLQECTQRLPQPNRDPVHADPDVHVAEAVGAVDKGVRPHGTTQSLVNARARARSPSIRPRHR